ncbi:hypothetical protein BVRB_9g211780 [Beta vulgaris subsp. vulgaris]|nr:hypothetical protein BVRB_9g211780 [Beta vulgaris subsp. vulgaris]
MELEKTIKNGKAETKITGPLFPRLHVDDTKKAGPRAPPRNKMALYHEQLSILPQRFSNTTTSILPPPPVHGCILTNMSSSNQVVSTERSLVSPYKNSPASAHSNGKQTPRSYEGLISDNTSMNFTKKSIQTNVAEKSLAKFTCKSFESFSLSHPKRPIINKDEAELRVPMFMHPHLILDSSNNHSGSTKDKLLVGASCPLELQTTTSAKEVKTVMSTDLESELNVRGFNSDKLEAHEAVQVHDKKLISIPEGSQEHDRNLTRDEQSESSDIMVNETDISRVRRHMVMPRQVKKVSEGVNHTRDVHQRTLDDGNQLEESRFCTSLVNLEDRNEDRSHTPVKDCASGAVISSDAVVEMIGQKYFWQARKTIIL